jgi:membrane protein DedA with SNARE-associated domain
MSSAAGSAVASCSSTAAGLWAVACTLLGYVFWNSLDRAVQLAQQGSFAIAGAVVLAIAGTYAVKRWRRRVAADPGR